MAHLYTLPQQSLAGFVTITTNSFYVIGAIVIFMVTGRLIYEWKLGSQQIQSVASEAEEVIEKAVKPKWYDDGAV